MPEPIPATATQPSPTPTIVWFPASATPTAQFLPTPGPTPERKPGVGQLVLADDFSSAKPWGSEDSSVDVSRHHLTLAAQPGVNAFRLRQGPTLTSFFAEITAEPSLCRDGDQYGLLFRAPSASGYYAYAVACNGTSLAGRMRLGRWFPLHDPVRSADVPLGAPGQVRLGVWASGTEMHFFLNGHYQFGISDPTLKSGAIGVFAQAVAGTPVTVTFSDLSIYDVTYVPPTATPTP
ncbi:MAG TPA: hypothetical protein VF784_15095 [Anaerolineales bacterium]